MELNVVEGDGRTVFGRIVPYGQTARVTSHDGSIKTEMFVRGALSRQVPAWPRVTLVFEHENHGFTNTLGYGLKLEERDNGGYASFRLYERDADKAREMLLTSHRFLSLEFWDKDREPNVDGVIVRDKVHVERVAMVTDPAYSSAEVLAVRESPIVDTPHLDDVLADLELIRQHPMLGGE